MPTNNREYSIVAKSKENPIRWGGKSWGDGENHPRFSKPSCRLALNL